MTLLCLKAWKRINLKSSVHMKASNSFFYISMFFLTLNSNVQILRFVFSLSNFLFWLEITNNEFAWFIFCIKYSTKFEFAIVARIPCLLIRHRFSLSSLANLAIYAHLLYSKMWKRIRSKCVFSGTCEITKLIFHITHNSQKYSETNMEVSKYLPWQLLFDFV